MLRIMYAMIGAMLWARWLSGAALAQQPAPEPQIRIQTPLAALAQDAGEYASRYGVSLGEAMRRLAAQQESVPFIDRLQAAYRDRLAGVFVEHQPSYRFVVSLTGTEPVADEMFAAGGMNVAIVFQTGASASRERILAAIEAHQADIRAALPNPPAMGVDPRNGTLVVIVRPGDVGDDGPDALAAKLSGIAGVPVHIRNWADADNDLNMLGGSRAVGVEPADGRRYVCTTGFVVTDGMRTGVTTAAHCPDALSSIAPDGKATPLTMVGAWGARYQDVQIGVTDTPFEPLFYADAARTLSRPVTSWRNRTSTRVGDFICHRGERSGYSCAEVEFVDFAPAGELCAGPCPALWVAVRGPSCNRGDSGGPVFSGTIAFGILKGASYARDGRCQLYYYMSTDYLPPGWTLLHR